jgi:hypothetical protein
VGTMRGAAAVAARFSERPDDAVLKAKIEMLMQDAAVACCEIWLAAAPNAFPVSEEERLRGGDRKIDACLLVETLRLPQAERIASALAVAFPQATLGVYRLLCEIRP